MQLTEHTLSTYNQKFECIQQIDCIFRNMESQQKFERIQIADSLLIGL